MIKGRLYRVHARNFTLAIYDGNAFVGIRSKFGGRFLDVEYHESAGSPLGTVRVVEDMGIDCPHELELLGPRASGGTAAAVFAWLDRVVVDPPTSI